VCPLFHILFALYIGTDIYFQFHKSHSYLLSISQISFISTSNFTNLIHIYFQYHKKLFNLLPKKLSMNPFDIEAYFQKRDIEDTYIVNRFIQRQKNLEEGSASRTRKYFNRDHAAANQRLIDDYFSNEPTYDDAMFRRRYRMQKHVFLRIVGDLSSSDNYFTQRVDAVNKEGISPLAKCTTTMRMLAYGVAADAVDEYIKIGSSTALECLLRFCKGIIRYKRCSYNWSVLESTNPR